MGGGDQVAGVGEGAAAARILQQHAETVAVGEQLGRAADDDLDAERLGPRAQHGQGLGMAVGVDEEALAAAFLVHALQQRHGLGGGRRLVEQGGVGQVHAREVHHQLLVGQERLEAALRDLRLVGRVGRVPARVLQHVALDHTRRVRAVIAHADEAAGHGIALGERAQLCQHIDLAARAGQVQGFATADGRRHRGVDQRVDAFVAGGDGHLALLRGRGADVARKELVVTFKGRHRVVVHGVLRSGASRPRKGVNGSSAAPTPPTRRRAASIPR